MDDKLMLWLLIAFIIGLFIKYIIEDMVCKDMCPLVEGGMFDKVAVAGNNFVGGVRSVGNTFVGGANNLFGGKKNTQSGTPVMPNINPCEEQLKKSQQEVARLTAGILEVDTLKENLQKHLAAGPPGTAGAG